jgi:hypothetical protein
MTYKMTTHVILYFPTQDDDKKDKVFPDDASIIEKTSNPYTENGIVNPGADMSASRISDIQFETHF